MIWKSSLFFWNVSSPKGPVWEFWFRVVLPVNSNSNPNWQAHRAFCDFPFPNTHTRPTKTIKINVDSCMCHLWLHSWWLLITLFYQFSVDYLEKLARGNSRATPLHIGKLVTRLWQSWWRLGGGRWYWGEKLSEGTVAGGRSEPKCKMKVFSRY